MTDWTAIVGIAGIAGSVATGYLTNRAAEKRLKLQQEFEDSRRFHKERAELYGRVLGLNQIFKMKAIELRRGIDRNDPDPAVAWQALTAVMVDMSGVCKTAQLLAEPNTQKAAQNLLSAAGALGSHMNVARDEYVRFDNQHRLAEVAFLDSATAELSSRKSDNNAADDKKAAP